MGIMDLFVIQGGMGIDVSNPNLAKTCSRFGILGTVTCTGAERMLVHKLQAGDLNGQCRHALAHFPYQEVANRILDKYFIFGGKLEEDEFKKVPIWSFTPRRDLVELAVAGSFVHVWLAKEGHDGPISVNYLEKLQWHIYHLVGAMLAGVDYVTMGAGITLQIPAVLDAIACGGVPSYRVDVEGGVGRQISFDPREFFGSFPKELKRPGFLPIVSTDALANIMVTKLPKDSIQGFVIETPDAGGHNAPPRKKGEFDVKGQPVYGPRDEVNFDKLGSFGIPFWIGGAYASPEGLAKAQKLGAVGIQAGSIFALCDDSGLDPYYRAEIRRLGYRGELEVISDPTASPTGFPFQVVQLPGTHSDPEVYADRERNCSIGALQFYAQLENGKVVPRCPAEPIDDYLRKGGKIEDTVGARCLCNMLFAAVNLAYYKERPGFTLGRDTSFLRRVMTHENDSYGAWQAIQWLLSR